MLYTVGTFGIFNLAILSTQCMGITINEFCSFNNGEILIANCKTLSHFN